MFNFSYHTADDERPTLACPSTSGTSPSTAETNTKAVHLNEHVLTKSPVKFCKMENTWESYGFQKKEYDWGAWYLVP
ncbi:hypothetical protein ACA910_008030 [Epithemia clementina (nom. ined.)]